MRETDWSNRERQQAIFRTVVVLAGLQDDNGDSKYPELRERLIQAPLEVLQEAGMTNLTVQRLTTILKSLRNVHPPASLNTEREAGDFLESDVIPLRTSCCDK